MTNAKHTPGPWNYGIDGTDKNYYIEQEESPHKKIGNIDTTEANARLIAAAPELLEACKIARQYFEDIVMLDDSNEDKLILETLDQAISKAEGTK